MTWKPFVAFALPVFALSLACTQERTLDREARDDSIIEGTGTVSFVGIEGGCWVIGVDGDGVLEPLGLDVGFRQDGLRVRFRAEVQAHKLSACQVGTIVEILNIEPLGEGEES